ncbi:hypothetical protein DPMN_037557 [Dreissena polymorpha]|uniref:TNFR-Cys domain-containing protein n=2 Tax=Dreissena polymorpha TaxID=45954 RepID=A0A9D4MDS5_DREPO|nr:hypothetical protein DPMN_037557 [Dreissena polymorpha]
MTECAVGYGVKMLAAQWSDTVCEQCTDGVTFSNVSSASSPCQLCTACPNGNTPFVKCNIQADTVCERNEVKRVINKDFTLTTVNIIEIVFGVAGLILLILIVINRQRLSPILLRMCRRKQPVKCVYTSVKQAGTGLSSRADDSDDSDDTSITSRPHVSLFTTYGRPLEAGAQAAGHATNGTNQPNATARLADPSDANNGRELL